MSDFEIDEGEGLLENPHRSATLEHIRERLQESLPVKNAACSDCPVSMWYRDKASVLICFCTALHKATWFEGCVPIEYCDGREQGIARLVATLKTQKQGK